MLHQSDRLRPAIAPLALLITLAFLSVHSINAQSLTGDRKANGKIAFVSNRDGVEKIYVMNPDGSGLAKLTDGPHHLQPSWSPDGTQIAYMGLVNEGTALFIMNADGSNRRQIATNVFHHVEPVWSPDGSKIAFGSAAPVPASNIQFSVHVIDVDGSHETRVANGSGSVTWSPNGKQLAVATFSGIDLINADGTNQRSFSRLPFPFPLGLSWSPDGSKILFGASRPASDSGVKGTSRYTIETIAADGSNGNDSKLIGYGTDAAWSPDGSRIVFIRRTPGSTATQIWVMDADGGNQTQLTQVGPNWRPSWQPLMTASRN